MRIVDKYDLVELLQGVSFPTGTKYLHHKVDSNNTVWVWFELDHESGYKYRQNFDVIGTGQKVPANYKYLFTYHENFLTWHVYAEKSLKEYF